MQIPLQISFRNMDASEAVEADVREKAARLSQFYERITSCRVVIDAPHHHHHKGNLYDVRIDLTVPGEEIVVQRSGPENQAHEDVYVAVRDAFNAATRRLQDHVRKTTGRMKSHEVPVHGTIVRLLRDKGYGFIETSEGEEIYFHRNSVVDGSFEDLGCRSGRSAGHRLRRERARFTSEHRQADRQAHHLID
jgi:ribosomal subunit interface protein